MPLHEYLEQKRRQNITKYNATGACHICGSTCRNKNGFSHYIDNEAAAAGGGNGYANENSMVPAPNLSAMRVCACFGTDWPYSIRVCEKCIEEDRTIGRIRNCGICGTVSCDENCGTELLECTDKVDMFNAGCLECRGLSDFSEMEVFCKQKIPPQNRGEPRITRICTKCLEQSTPWVKYDFVCRLFRCETRLVLSDIAERKRFCTFGSSPLNLLPEDGLVTVVNFLPGSDLKQLFLTCSAMCTVAERVAKERIERVSNLYPTGPIVTTKRKDGSGQFNVWTHFKGQNDFGLRAPDDGKTWVGVYHSLEKITKEIFYFGFQLGRVVDLTGSTETEVDREVVGRFINSDVEKFAFGQTYTKMDNNLIPSPATGYMVRGGCILITANGVGGPVTIASNKQLVSGTSRVICRLFCPGTGGSRNNRDINNDKLGSIGILRTNQRGVDGVTTSWAQHVTVSEGWIKEDVVVGVEYNAEERKLRIHSNSHTSRSSLFISNCYTLDDVAGDLYIAAELTAKSANVAQTLLTAREVSEDEWEQFLDHTDQSRLLVEAAAAANVGEAVALFERVAAMDGADGPDGEGNADGGHARAARHRDLRQAMRNRQRERDAQGDNDENNFHRIQVRAIDEGRLGVMLPRRVENVEAAALGNNEADVEDEGMPERELNVEHRWGPRRVVRALRQFVPEFARAAAMPRDVHNDDQNNNNNNNNNALEAQAEGDVDIMGEIAYLDEANLMHMDEEVAAGEFFQQIQQAWQLEEVEPDQQREAIEID